MTYYVCFQSSDLETLDYVGPFYSEEDAADYADYQNQGLANNGIPSSVACYWVV
jgi:hypothetical protein